MKDRSKYLFLLPGLIWIFAFTAFPMLYTFVLSFTNARLGRAAEFVGLQNYVNIFSDPKIDEVTLISASQVVASTGLTLVLGTFIAWLFNHSLPGLRVMRAILTMPLFVAPIALGYMGVVLFNERNGPINNLIGALGGTPVSWLTAAAPARLAVLITDVWAWTPFVFIVILATIQSIPDEVLEAARLDTSSDWLIFTHITLPHITPALGTVALLRLVETLKILDIPLTLTGGGPGQATHTYSYYAYLTGLRSPFQQGYSSSMSVLMVVVAMIISAIYFWRVRSRFDQGSI
jgi:multiple sugar transport system permease protein